MRRWILWLLVIVFLWQGISHFSEMQAIAETVARGRWWWIAVAILLQIAYYLVFVAMYQSAFNAVNIASQLSDLLPVAFASIFVNTTAPSAGASGVALWVDDAAQRGQSPTRAWAGLLLVHAIDYTAFVPILVVGLIYQYQQHGIEPYELVGGMALLAVLLGLMGILALGFVRPPWLHRLLGWIQNSANRLTNRFRRTPLLREDWAASNTAEFAAAATAIVVRPWRVLRTLGIALALNLVSLAVLYTLFLAFYQAVSIKVLVVGFAMASLFWRIGITPQGIGVVEGIMIWVYSSLGVPVAAATSIALAFRGLGFWLPLLIGFLVLRRIRSFAAGKRPAMQIEG